MTQLCKCNNSSCLWWN